MQNNTSNFLYNFLSLQTRQRKLKMWIKQVSNCTMFHIWISAFVVSKVCKI